MLTMNTRTPTTNEKNIISVSQLNRRAKQLLETHLPLIWVSGEISNLAKPSSGHWYFTLKDNQAQVRCAMFRTNNQRLRWDPKSGDQVLLRARVSLYEGRGDYQLIAEHMEAAGDGLLQQRYERLKAKLDTEGLFDASRKQTLPAFPQHIGVITSPTGAAVHDILSVLKRRYPVAPVTIFPVSVQGENAVPEILTALQKAQNFQQCNVLIIARGGGSIEDLWAFNDENLARAIADCSIPIISAVGHEVDFTIADFVADVRAPTPSVSAEIIAPDISEWLQTVDYHQVNLYQQWQAIISKLEQKLTFLRKRLRHPGERIDAQQQQLSYLKKRLLLSVQQELDKKESRTTQSQQRLRLQHPKHRIKAAEQRVTKASSELQRITQQQLQQKEQHFTQTIALLNAMSPLTVLSRGYSTTRTINDDTQGDIVKNSHDVMIGETIVTQLAQGSIKSCITALEHTPPNEET